MEFQNSKNLPYFCQFSLFQSISFKSLERFFPNMMNYFMVDDMTCEQDIHVKLLDFVKYL